MATHLTSCRCLLTAWLILHSGAWVGAEDSPLTKRVAAVVTEYRRNSHADVILGRLLETDTLDGMGRQPQLELVSLYVDQFPKNDLSRELAQQHGFRLCETIREALTLGTDKLAVDGVLIIAEHGDYPRSETGQTMYPKRRFFEEVVQVFDRSGRVVSVFSDKHLADNTPDAIWIYQALQERHVPFMAGSSVVSSWRAPALDVAREETLRDILVLSYGSLDAYGFHGLDLLQGLVERRGGGETGVARVRCLSGDDVWNAQPGEVYRPELLQAALGRLRLLASRREKPLTELVKEPVAYVIDYRDGVRGTVLTLNGAVAEWAAAWQTTTAKEPQALVIDLQDERPFMHFAHMLQGIESMMQTSKPAWPVERTLYSTVMLDAALTSRQAGGIWIETPEIQQGYKSSWNWSQPGPAGKSSPQ